jgi:multidrug resistance efflux pump
VLIAFDCEEIQLELDKAESDFKLSEAVLKNTRDLKKLNSASNLEVAKAEGEHERNIAQVRLLQFKEKQCKLIAPYDGETIVQEVNAHETVKIGDPLLTIVNNQSLEVEIYVPSVWLKDIHIGSSFQLRLDEFSPDKTFHGVVTQIVDRIDPASQSALIYGKLQNNTGLFAGMSGVAQFEVNSPVNESAKSPVVMSSLLPQDIMSVVSDWSYPLLMANTKGS